MNKAQELDARMCKYYENRDTKIQEYIDKIYPEFIKNCEIEADNGMAAHYFVPEKWTHIYCPVGWDSAVLRDAFIKRLEENGFSVEVESEAKRFLVSWHKSRQKS